MTSFLDLSFAHPSLCILHVCSIAYAISWAAAQGSTTAMDPYHIVREQVEASLQSATSLHSSYKRILATVPKTSQASSEELSWSREELEGTLVSLEADLEELEMSVDTVSQDPARFGLDVTEVRQRQAFVARVKGMYVSQRKRHLY